MTAPTNDQIIDQILAEEGSASNTPGDAGGPTAYGISKASNPGAWVNGPPSAAAARQIYMNKYLVGPGFDKVNDAYLREQLVDFGVNSGPGCAIMSLQRILGVPIDGVLGPDSLAAANGMNPTKLNNKLVIARLLMISRIVTNNPTQLKFLSGWISRAAEFIL